MSREEFQGEEYGGLIEEYTFEVTDSYYATVPTYDLKSARGGHMLFLHWLGKTDVGAMPLMDAAGYHPSFKCGHPKGDDWVSLDSGKTATHPNPDVVHFDSRTDMGKLNERLLKITEHLEGKPDDPLANMDPRNAAEFIGFVFKMKREEFSFQSGNDTIKYSLDLPVEFLGKGTGLPSGSTVSTAAPAPTPQTPAAASTGARAAVEALAKAAADYATFQRQALQVAGVTDDQVLLTEVLDETGGIYANR